MQQGKADDAIVELESIKASAPNTPGLDLELGTAYYKKSDYVKAIGFLKTTVAADPSNNEAIQLLGLSYYLNGYPAQAIPLPEKVQTWFHISQRHNNILMQCKFCRKSFSQNDILSSV